MNENFIFLMRGYFASKYENGDDVKIILNEFKIHTLENPKALYSMTDDVDKYIYKEDVKAYAKYNFALTRSAKNS